MQVKVAEVTNADGEAKSRQTAILPLPFSNATIWKGYFYDECYLHEDHK
jgi:hypothetical protein